MLITLFLNGSLFFISESGTLTQYSPVKFRGDSPEIYQNHPRKSDLKNKQAGHISTLKASITTKFVCFYRLLKCYRSIFNKTVKSQICAHTVSLLNNVSKKCSRRQKQMEYSDDFCWPLKESALKSSENVICLCRLLHVFAKII